MAILGELEARIMAVLWRQDAPVSVREVHETLLQERELAYTTVMTVLDRLAKKGLVQRERDGRAWLYVSGPTRAELYGQAAVETLQESGDDLPAVLAHLVTELDEGQRAQLREALGSR